MGKSCGAVRPGADRLSYPLIYDIINLVPVDKPDLRSGE